MHSPMFKIVLALLFLLLQTVTVFAQNEANKALGVVAPEETVEAVIEKIQEMSSNSGSEKDEKKEAVLPFVETLTGDPQIEDMVRRIHLYNPDVLMTQMGSLFFTAYEQNLISKARKGFATRAPTETEVKGSIKEQKEGRRPAKGPREIFLGGIIYASSADWAVWLNGQKITPDRLPPEILDIHVYKDFIKLKWFDAYTNQIFPIKIRTHQRFNIDTRIFLPG